MSTDFRALCRELTDVLAELPFGTCEELVVRARAALAQPVPPVAGELGELVKKLRSTADGLESQAYPQTAALITRAADLLAQRHSAPVRLQQLESLAADAVSALRYIEQHHGRLYGVGWDRVFSEAAKLQPAPIPALPEDATVIEPSERTILVPIPEPVPVAERWPEFSDCDRADDRVWCFSPELSHWKLSRIARAVHSHWLPFHALPLPQLPQQETTNG